MVFEFVGEILHEWRVAKSFKRIEESRKKESERLNELLGKFINEAGLESRKSKRESGTVMFVGSEDMSVNGSEVAGIIKGFLNFVSNRPLFYECFQVAREIVKHDIADGRIAVFGGEGNGKLLNYGSHCVNYLELEQGVAAVDYTAGRNIDRGQGNFDVLVVTANDLSQLFSRMSSLYGGDWEMIQND